MPEILNTLSCPDCGGPLKVHPGDAIVTCGYCGSDVNLAVGTKYFLKHSIIPPKIASDGIDSAVKGWMGRGFLKPGDLARKSKIRSKELQILPLFIVQATARTEYDGLLTRTGENCKKQGVMEKEYYWKVLGRRASKFPTRDYEVPLAAKTNFDISSLIPGAKFLNSEIGEDEAITTAKREMEEHHRFLLGREMDTVSSCVTKVEVRNTEFLHVPAWFISYEYRGKYYDLILDAATGEDIMAEIPQEESKGLRSLFGG